MTPISWDEIPEEIVSSNVKRKMFWGENLMVVRVQLAPVTEIPMHDHVSEQITCIENGTALMSFQDGTEAELGIGDMIVIPSSKGHAVKTGPDGCILIDFFSPIRQDFIQGKESAIDKNISDPYQRLHGFLRAKGIKTGLDKLQELPLEILARYVYEKECITMGQLREILGIDKNKARALLRQWKHGDDHSESSYKRKFERLIDLDGIKPFTVEE
jgi:quercetin dioxygenase-like cupin family protein